MLSLSLAIYGCLEEGCSKNDEHATIPKSKMGYDQYTVPDTIASCRTYFCCFHLSFADVHPWPLVPFFQISLKNSEPKNHPQLYLSGLSRVLFPKTFLKRI